MLHFPKAAVALGFALLAASMVGQSNEPEVHPHPSDQFKRYRAIEAYELRPGILMMPRYSADGRVCEIGLQKRIYSPELVRLDPELERKQIEQIVDELVPVEERGPRSPGLLGMGMITISGFGMDQLDDYQNVSVETFDRVLSHSKKTTKVEGDLAVVIRWKQRKCE